MMHALFLETLALVSIYSKQSSVVNQSYHTTSY